MQMHETNHTGIFREPYGQPKRSMELIDIVYEILRT
jgi:hypothetical protein